MLTLIYTFSQHFLNLKYSFITTFGIEKIVLIRLFNMSFSFKRIYVHYFIPKLLVPKIYAETDSLQGKYVIHPQIINANRAA